MNPIIGALHAEKISEAVLRYVFRIAFSVSLFASRKNYVGIFSPTEIYGQKFQIIHDNPFKKKKFR